MSAKEPAEDGDKDAAASGSRFERTITVVKGNASLGLCYFLSYLLTLPSRLRANGAAVLPLVARVCKAKSCSVSSCFSKASPGERGSVPAPASISGIQC